MQTRRCDLQTKSLYAPNDQSHAFAKTFPSRSHAWTIQSYVRCPPVRYSPNNNLIDSDV